MYEDLLAQLCRSCLGKKVNESATVEDTLRNVIPQAVAVNGPFAGWFLLQGAILTLEKQGGDQACIAVLKSIGVALKNFGLNSMG